MFHEGGRNRRPDGLVPGGEGALVFPVFFVSIVTEDKGGDAALGIALDGDAGEAAAVGIEEGSE